MPVTLAVANRDQKRPPPLPSSVEVRGFAREQSDDAGAASAAAPPLPSMRVPKGAIRHDQGSEEIDVAAAVLRARRATEELEWQAQVKRAKETLEQSEAVEWNAMRARTAALPVETPPRAAQPKKPALLLARVPATVEKHAADNTAPVHLDSEQAAEEREWQALRTRARLAEEREWQELIARAHSTGQATARPATARIVAWP